MFGQCQLFSSLKVNVTAKRLVQVIIVFFIIIGRLTKENTSEGVVRRVITIKKCEEKKNESS